jgi:hypothetical protein
MSARTICASALGRVWHRPAEMAEQAPRPSSRSARLLAIAPFLFIGAAAWALAARADARWYERHVLVYCFLKTPAVLWWSVHLRQVLVGVGLFCVGLLAPISERWARRRTVLGVLGGWLRVGLAVAIAFTASELALRWHEGKRLAEQQRGVKPAPADLRVRLCDPHPRYGWLYRPSQTYEGQFGGRIVPFTIDRESDRAATQASRPDHDRPTVLFVGESVSAGQGLFYEETFPALVGAALGVQEVNQGVLGYASDQAYLRLVDALPTYRNPVAVVTLFVPFMLSRNFHHWRTHLELDGQGHITVVGPSSLVGPQSRLAHLLFDGVPYRDDAFTRRSVDLLRAIFADTGARARARGAYPLFVIPTYGPSRPLDQRGDGWLIRELFESQGLPYLLVDIDPNDIVPGDGHPSAAGAALIARQVTAALRAAGVGGPRP